MNMSPIAPALILVCMFRLTHLRVDFCFLSIGTVAILLVEHAFCANRDQFCLLHFQQPSGRLCKTVQLRSLLENACFISDRSQIRTVAFTHSKPITWRVSAPIYEIGPSEPIPKNHFRTISICVNGVPCEASEIHSR